MITETILKLWFPDINEDQIEKLIALYNRVYNQEKDMVDVIDGHKEFDKLTVNLQKYHQTKDIKFTNLAMFNKARLDIVKDFNS